MMRARSLKRFSWNTETQALYEQHLAQELEFTNLDTLFGAALRTGDPVISNNLAHDPRRARARARANRDSTYHQGDA